ncbi:MAG TPA: heme biosynthesis HemY N-terminal domain-containing protein [Methylocella sp.]|nr:heme biosynthesis HemY N-terminal domain-containing protein [Methylocella sp.]
MFRVPLYFLLLIALAFGLAWLVDRPGEILLTWEGYQVKTSVLVALGVVLALTIVLTIIWNLLRFIFGLAPSLTRASQVRRREKGYAALSRGFIAVGTGDAKLAAKAAAETQKFLPGEPLALLLRAEAAQLIGNHQAVEAAFKEMTKRHDTRLLGFRGLHAHAHRHGDFAAAHHYASSAHNLGALPWSAAAVLEKYVAAKDWAGALSALDKSADLIDRPVRDRQRAVLATALALDIEQSDPDEALRLARSAVKRAPDLVPAVALAARLQSSKGGNRKAAKMIETAWPLAPHPDLAKTYLDLHPDESHAQRLARARVFMKLAPRDPESRLALASAAIAAGDYKTARETMLPLIQAEERPTARMCLVMAEIEDAEHGASGFARDWLARATRAPRDAAWVAGSVISNRWMPASPVTGKLDAFAWRKPDEWLSSDSASEDAIFRPILSAEESPILIEKPRPAIAPPEHESSVDADAYSQGLTEPSRPTDSEEPNTNASTELAAKAAPNAQA